MFQLESCLEVLALMLVFIIYILRNTHQKNYVVNFYLDFYHSSLLL